MNMERAFVLSLLSVIMLALPVPAHAITEGRPILLDHRVRTLMYQPDEVYRFVGHYRYQSSIEFGADEEIRTISMGDSTSWMLNPSGNRLFLKPIEQDATTNMTLITNRRTYLFELLARETDDIDDPSMTFILRFMYPDEEGPGTEIVSNYLDSVPIPELDEHPEKYNFDYTISGADVIAPLRIFDDGQFTYFQFRNVNADVPAFFLVDDRGEESLINYRTRGDYIVIERVARKFTLRHGKDIVCVFNEGRMPLGLPDPITGQ